jgi:hypothetical protein
MKNILISYVIDADTDKEAISHLKALLYLLPQDYAKNFQVFDICDVDNSVLA